MNYNDMRVTFMPKVAVNPAITLEGSVNLTSLGIHSAGRPVRHAMEHQVKSIAFMCLSATGRLP